jgi:WXXGXW repeat (2 copies)
MRRSYLGFLLLLIFGSLLAPVSAPAYAGIGVSITVAPPAIPVYTQPICPGPNYIWTPGYWAWGPDGYYWVPGTWVVAPAVGLLWTPGYWGWGNGVYLWHAGYLGPHVGFYGGINYGFGYFGVGYEGGYWRGRDFFYNRSVTRVNTTVIHNVYNRRVVERSVSRASYNGGRGGIDAHPSGREEAAMRERRFGATSGQERQESLARSDRRQWASENHGRPGVTASQRTGELSGRSAEARSTRAANDARNHAAETRASEAHRSAEANRSHSANNAPRESARTAHPNTAPRANTATHNTEHHNVSAPHTNHAQTPHTAVRTEPSRTHTNTNAARQPNHSEVRSPSTSTHNAAPRQNVRQEHSAPTHAPAQHPAPQSHATQHASGGGGERSGNGGHGNTPRGGK